MRLPLGVMLCMSLFVFIALAYSTSAPEMITLDSLSNVYGPVEFSHRGHIDMLNDCTICHHHNVKGATFSSCKQCHEPTSLYHYKGSMRIAGLGLKGAYHRQCIGCHREMESGPMGCPDCHTKKDAK